MPKIELVPPHLFEGEGREECLADLYQSVGDLLKGAGAQCITPDLFNHLPVVDWSLCEGVPGYVTLRLFARRSPDGTLPPFLFEMVNRHLLGGHHVEIFTSQHVVFTLPELGNGELLYIAMAIHVERQVELAEIAATLPCLAPDLELAALAPEFAAPLQQILVAERSEDLMRIRCAALRWLRRWDDTPPTELLRLFSPFSSAIHKGFREIRSTDHLASLFKRLVLLRKAVLRRWNLAPDHRALRLSLLCTELHYPFGTKGVTGVCVAVSGDRNWEVFEESAAQSAVSTILKEAQVVSGSFFTYHSPREKIRFIYFEIAKSDQGPLHPKEIALVRRRLPLELEARIGTLSHSLFMPRNEEEVLRNILALSGDVKSRNTPPQVVVSFQEIGIERLTFTVTLVRLLTKDAPTTPKILDHLPSEWRADLEQDRIVGHLRQIQKSASVFTISLPNAAFLRRDRSVDLYGARAALTAHLARLLPGLTDYHGGLLLKQEQILNEARKMSAEQILDYGGVLDELFYSLSPGIMQSYLQPRLIVRLFSSIVDLSKVPFDREKGYSLVTSYGQGAHLVTVRARTDGFQSHLQTAIECLSFDPLQIAYATATCGGFHFAVALYLSEEDSGGQRLEEAASACMERWTEEQRGRQILRLTIPRVESSLDPRIGVDRRSGIVIKMLYEGLMRMEKGGPACAIARSVHLSEDQKTYTFTLRPSQWSNGDPLTSADFTYAWKKFIDPQFCSRYAYLFFPIKGAEEAHKGEIPLDEIGLRAISPDKLVVELIQPLPSFLELVSHWVYSPLHRLIDVTTPDWAEAKGEAYICNGPFRLSDRHSERGLVLVKNSRYWASEAVRLEGIEVFSIADSMMALTLFEQGELDWIGEPLIDIPAKALYESLGEQRIQTHLMSSVHLLELNVECPPFDSKTMREAFTVALDRDRIVRELDAKGDVSARRLFPPSMGLPNESPLPTGDRLYARKLFDQACKEQELDRSSFPIITCCHPQLPGHEEIALAIARQWREAFGIEVAVKAYQWNVYRDWVRSQEFHASADTLVSWYSDLLYNLNIFRSRSNAFNGTRWEHPHYRYLLSKAERCLDLEEKKELACAAERLALEEAVVLPISYRKSRYAVREGVVGIFLSEIGQVDFSRAHIRPSTHSKKLAAPRKSKRKTVSLNLAQPPLSIDPRLGGDRRSQTVTRMLFDGLVRVTPDGALSPSMAEEIHLSDDRTRYTFRLRKAQWTDGKPVTAHDFEYTWKSLLHPDFKSPYAVSLYAVKGAREAKKGKIPTDAVGIYAPSDRELIVELDHPAPHFLHCVANGVLAPIPSGSDEANPAWAKGAPSFVSNGPFRLVRCDERRIQVEKNPTYWDAKVVKVDQVNLSIKDDPKNLLAAFDRGDLQWAGEPLSELPFETVAALRKEGRLKSERVLGVYRCEMNVTRPPFTSTKMRKAFAYALDRRALISEVLGGEESVAHSLLPAAFTFQSEPLFERVDQGEARKLFEKALKEEGWTRKTFPKTVLTYTSLAGQKAIAEGLRSQWQTAFGISIELERLEWNVYLERCDTCDYQIAGVSWYSLYDDPIYNLEGLKHRGERSNATEWENTDFIAALDASDRAPDTEQRTAYLKRAEEIALDEMPVIPLFTTQYKYVIDPRLTGVFVSRPGYIDFKWADLNR